MSEIFRARLHVVVASHLVGNIFWELVAHRKPWGTTQEANTAALYEDLKTCEKHGLPGKTYSGAHSHIGGLAETEGQSGRN